MRYTVFIILCIFVIFFSLSILYTKSFFGLYEQIRNKRREYNNSFVRNKILESSTNLKLPEVEFSKEIPKKIFQTHENINLIPDYYLENLKKLNPGYEYIFHDKSERENFILSNYGDKFLKKMNSFKRGAHKADFWRLCVLYKHGGCYIDADIEMKIPFQEIINSTRQDLIIPITELKIGRDRLFNAMIICKPGNYLIGECLKRIILVENKHLEDYYHFLLFLMQDILENKISFDFKEKYIPKNIFNLSPEPKDYFIVSKDNTIVAKSKRDDYI